MKQRSIIVNNDFYNIFQVEPPVTDQDVYDAVDKMAGTQVDTLFLLVPNGLTKPGKEAVGPDLISLYEHPETDPWIRNLNAYSEQGKDPFQMVLERARQHGIEFFASIRMNDTHYLDQIFNPWVPQFYYDNLHNRVGAGGSRGGAEFDYRVSAIRDYMLDMIKEAVRRYDVDGIELDCTRNCMFFPRGDLDSGLTPECAPIFTEFMRQVRNTLDEVGKERGRKIELCVTIPGSLHHARGEGLDIPVWAQLGLLDMLCLSTPFYADFDRDVADTKLKVPGVQVYAGCDRNFEWPGRAVPLETYRALAMNYWQQGADGIYLYNVMIWTIDAARLPAMLLRHGGQGEGDCDQQLMNELGDMTTLAQLDKLYLISHSGEAADKPYAALPVTVPAGGEVTLRMRIGDDIVGNAKCIESIQLQTISSDCADYGNYTIKLNTVDLARQYAFAAFAETPKNPLLFPEPNRTGVLPAVEKVRRHPVRPIDLHTGVNYITIKSYRDALTITDVELAIHYRG